MIISGPQDDCGMSVKMQQDDCGMNIKLIEKGRRNQPKK